jgi:hypothetical protein
MLAVELADALGIHQLDGQVSVGHARGRESGERGRPQLLGGLDELQLDQRLGLLAPRGA